jgi:hypothetical protein
VVFAREVDWRLEWVLIENALGGAETRASGFARVGGEKGEGSG